MHRDDKHPFWASAGDTPFGVRVLDRPYHRIPTGYLRRWGPMAVNRRQRWLGLGLVVVFLQCVQQLHAVADGDVPDPAALGGQDGRDPA
jgi:hypothetical protein